MPSVLTASCRIAPIVLVALAALPTRALPQPEIEWRVEVPSVWGSAVGYPAANPDSVVTSNGGRAVRISGNGKIIFSVEFGPEASRGEVLEPSVVDLDGDGTDEIITGHNDGLIVALAGDDGRVLWEYDLGTSLATWRMPVTADLDGDGAAEVLAGNMDGWMACINGDGRLRWRSKIEEYRLSTPSVGDINNDGRMEIVYGTSTRHLIALNDAGELLWDRFHPPLHMGRTKPVITDLDGDGAAEILTMSSMISEDIGLLCVNGADGTVKWEGATWHKAYHGLTAVKLADGSPGVLACDKGGNVGAYGAGGKLHWRTQLLGQGIWTPPVQADIDGDGRQEILFTMRNKSLDGKNNSWFVLSDTGEELGAYEGVNGYHSPLVADIDGDGVLEVTIAFSPGEVICYSFGGAATDDAVVVADWRGQLLHPLREPSVKEVAAVPEVTLANAEKVTRYGMQYLQATIPSGAGGDAIEVSVEQPGGGSWRRVFRAGEDTGAVRAEYPVYETGKHQLTLRLLDSTSGTVAGQQQFAVTVADLAKQLLQLRDTALEQLASIEGNAAVERLENIAMLGSRATNIRLAGKGLAQRIASASQRPTIEKETLAADVAGFVQQLEDLGRLSELLDATWRAESGSDFVLWQDKNPWDNTPPINTLPSAGGPLTVKTWAFGREIESIAINALNLTSQGMSLRFEPGQLFKAGEEKPLGPAEEVATLMRAVWLPSRFGEVVPDMLPELGDGYLLDIAPGEVNQLWINLSTHGLEPGSYELRWPIHTLTQPPAEQTLTIALDVSPVQLPEESRFLTGYWSKNNIGEFSTVPNLTEHLQTLWYQLPLPAAEADAEGNLVGAMDWSDHDAILTEAGQVDMILYSGPRVPKFPEGVEVTDALRKKGKGNYFQAMVDHLAQYGLGPENFCFYVQDEPGLRGTVDQYLEGAKENKEIDPRIQNYANPWGGVTVQNIRDMAPYTDVWQPGMETIEYLGPDYVDAMRAEGKRIAMYTPPDNCRILRPLGFYRAQPWQAFHWGIEGGGWWVYYQGDNLFATDANEEPSFAAIHYDGRALVNSRRWEAQRDGVEDFNALTMLAELVEEKNDVAARQVIKEAVAYVASETITGMPRESADYDMDFATLSEHRQRIREALERLTTAAE